MIEARLEKQSNAIFLQNYLQGSSVQGTVSSQDSAEVDIVVAAIPPVPDWAPFQENAVPCFPLTDTIFFLQITEFTCKPQNKLQKLDKRR